MYSNSLDYIGCLNYYKSFKKKLKNQIFRLVKSPSEIDKIVVVFHTLAGYSEWDIIYKGIKNIYLPIGDNLFLELIE